MKRTIILKLKLHRPVSMRLRTMEKLLVRTSRLCDQARNAAIRQWELDRRANPWWPEYQRSKTGELRLYRERPIFKKQIGPEKRDGVTMGTWLYRRVREQVPDLNSALTVHCVQNAITKLKSKVPYDSDCESHWFWEAILRYDLQPPTYRRRTIPVPNNSMHLFLTPECMIDIPLLSSQDPSGLPRRLRVSLRSAALSRGQRLWLRRIDLGEVKLSDSSLVKKNGHWYFHAVILQDAPVGTLDLSRTAVLRASFEPDGDRPFMLELPDGSQMGVGMGVPLSAEVRRVVLRRKSVRNMSRMGVARGKGKDRFYSVLRPMSHRLDHVKDAFACEAADYVAQLCHRHNCGSLIYEEPSRFMRQKTWLEQHNVTVTWARLLARIQGRMLREGIKLSVKEFKLAEARERGVV